ncbi:MAG: YggT family protein [bacterium]|nr:YggT family protein [bacterium]
MENVPLKIQRFAYDMVYYALWIIEIILFLRFLLKLLGANPVNEFISFLYSISGVLMGPFTDMFGVSAVNNMVLEPSILIAMVFYAIVAYVLVTFLRMLGPHQVRVN